MRNILFLFIALLFAANAIAQPTLAASTTNPVAGNRFYGHYQDDTTGISKGASGPSVTWDLGHMDSTYTDTTLYLPCASTPFCDSFPGSTLASFDGSEYLYITTDAAKFAYSGVGEFASMSGGCVYYPNLQNLLAYPTTYGAVTADSFYSAQPTFQFYSYGVDSFFADGYGTLILPSGTYDSVLRIHMINYETDSFDLGGFPDAITARLDYYFWYRPGFHNAMLEISYDTTGNNGIPYISDVEYYTRGIDSTMSVDTTHPSGVVTITNDAQVRVYPNPANNMVHISYVSPAAQPISISATDMLGRTAAAPKNEQLSTGINELDYDVSSLPPGMYYLKIKTTTGATTKKIVVER